jgi:hypothetical protein
MAEFGFKGKTRKQQKSNKMDTRKREPSPQQVWIDENNSIVPQKGAKGAIPATVKLSGFARK